MSNLLLCLYKPELLDEVMRQVKSYKGDYYIIRRVFKQLAKIYFDERVKNDKDKKHISEVILGFIKLYRDITYTEQLLKVKIYDKKEFAYYTTLQTFSYLLYDKGNLNKKYEKDVGQSGKHRLSIMNVGYMNDPNEGRVLHDILKLYANNSNVYNMLIGNTDKKIRKQYNNVLVFLKSFSNKVDKLTMWSEYGDKGKGCCVVVDGETFRACKVKLSLMDFGDKNKITVDDDYNLYNVAYWDGINNFIVDGEKSIEVKKMIAKIVEDIFIISDKFELIESVFNRDYTVIESIVSMLNDLLSRLCYLIKYDEYEDENEVRLVFQRDMKNNKDDIVKIENKLDNLRSMLYIHYPINTLIKEVILGPKVVDYDYYAPFISMKLSEINYDCNYETKLTISSIDYR